MKECVYIYALEYPKGNVRYIGKANNFRKRYRRHIRDAMKCTSSHRLAWIRSILNQGDLPYITIVDSVPKSEWGYWEQYYIKKYREDGYDLVNETIGGDGNFEPPKSVRDKISNTLKEYYKTHSIWNKGTKGVSVGYPKGKKRTKEDAEANSKRKKEYYKSHNIWNKGKIFSPVEPNPNYVGRQNLKTRHILQCDLNGNVIREWQSVSVARNTLGLHRGPIVHCLEGGQSEAYGFIWRYKEEIS